MKNGGKAMLFDKNILPACALCEHGSPINEDTILCHKHGPVAVTDSCRSFKYDPLLRVPKGPAAPSKKFKPEDFALE